MTIDQIRAARLYLQGKSLEQAGHTTRMSAQDVLHSVAAYLRSKREANPECATCGFHCTNRPCVLPVGVCRIGEEARCERK